MALAGGIHLNRIQTGQVVGEQADQRGINPFRLPGGDHVVAEHVNAQRGGVANLDVLIAAQPGQIDGGVQSIAAKALLHRAENLAAQLDHAFAKQHDSAK